MPAYLIACILVLISCEKKAGEKKQTGKLNGLHKYYFPDGELYLEINYKDSLPHGITKRYYKAGGLLEQTEYVAGIQHGVSKMYHENGQLSRETPYDKGRIHGVQKKYRKDGTLAFEAPYFYGNPCVGVKEYYLSGNPVKDYPTITVRAKDELLKSDLYTLYISMSNHSKSVQFYKGKLTEGKYIGNDAQVIHTTDDGVGVLYYSLPPGAFVMEKINILAKIKTDLGNSYITQLTYNLAAENR